MKYNQKRGNGLYIAAAVSIFIAGLALIYQRRRNASYIKYTKACLYLAALDDEICRNELEGNSIGDSKILFPPKEDSIPYRYELFLETYKDFSLKELNREIKDFEQRLEESRQYINDKKVKLQLEIQ